MVVSREVARVVACLIVACTPHAAAAQERVAEQVNAQYDDDLQDMRSARALRSALQHTVRMKPGAARDARLRAEGRRLGWLLEAELRERHIELRRAERGAVPTEVRLSWIEARRGQRVVRQLFRQHQRVRVRRDAASARERLYLASALYQWSQEELRQRARHRAWMQRTREPASTWTRDDHLAQHRSALFGEQAASLREQCRVLPCQEELRELDRALGDAVRGEMVEQKREYAAARAAYRNASTPATLAALRRERDEQFTAAQLLHRFRQIDGMLGSRWVHARARLAADLARFNAREVRALAEHRAAHPVKRSGARTRQGVPTRGVFGGGASRP